MKEKVALRRSFLVALTLACALSGCREKRAPQAPRTTLATREHAEEEAVQALANDSAEIRRRVNGAYVNVPGLAEPIHLADGRGKGPGDPPAFNLELRSVAGIVPGKEGIDVFVDLALLRPLKAPECSLALLHLDSVEAVHTSSATIGDGARVLSVEPDNVQGDVYDLKVDYLGRAPKGDFMSYPTDRKRKVLKVAHHSFGDGKLAPPLAPHGEGMSSSPRR